MFSSSRSVRGAIPFAAFVLAAQGLHKLKASISWSSVYLVSPAGGAVIALILAAQGLHRLRALGLGAITGSSMLSGTSTSTW
ncbi:hypothetical protein FR483_n846L [Paramecium bursaria Chlorella virus FR483]|uniref:Uncharacterized protein n846L n=1 Tax=Paramecium bursaria Chlorella virus FR483 TaxID=399781 RepID=A7J8K0_PBCVF|nr:hypothetical protein FR483_n846L [Paramecium bursaria Chlorella virus FR483]ABT16131.1 hypothetical protein FR483_n846L [Paramecium bursaria Chlorella virus FR483]